MILEKPILPYPPATKEQVGRLTPQERDERHRVHVRNMYRQNASDKRLREVIEDAQRVLDERASEQSQDWLE